MTEEDKEKPIVIDIKNIDTKATENFVQYEAFKDLTTFLTNDLNKKVKKKDKYYNQRTHNTIFVNGERGSGKTQFLLSIKNYIKDKSKENKKLKGLYFFTPIDPTLLHDNENFLTIIIAKILNNLENNKKLCNLTSDEEKSFYQLLSNISKAIDGVINNTNEKRTALENISQDQTSLRLEEYLNEFFYQITKIIRKKRLVLLIDDVDMALDKGFEVLEVLRKYLTSPYIIPIVTGNENLYLLTLRRNFDKKIGLNQKVTYQNEMNIDTYTGNNNIINMNNNEDTFSNINNKGSLALDYLTKVFPLNKRISIKTLYELSLSQEIIFKYDKDYNEDDVYAHIKSIFENEPISAKRFRKNLLQNPLRRIVQFLHGEIKLNENENSFSLKDFTNIKKINKKYYLNLLEGIRTWETYLEEGKEAFLLGKHKEAIKYCDESLKLKKTPDAYFHKGNTQAILAELNNDEEEYEKALNNYSKIINNEKFEIISKFVTVYLKMIELKFINDQNYFKIDNKNEYVPVYALNNKIDDTYKKIINNMLTPRHSAKIC